MKQRAAKRRPRNDVSGYFFTLPSNLLLFTFILLPVLISIVLSFAKFNGFAKLEWVGLRNYLTLLKDRDYRIALWNTLRYILMTVPMLTLIPMILAAILANYFRNSFGAFARGTMFIPVLCSTVLAGSIFYYLFASNQDAPVNLLLSMFGISKHNWLGDPKTALSIVALVAVWRDVGYYLVIFYAGIMDVPRDYFEAARIDGASAIQQFLHITLPCLRPIIYLVVTMSTIWAFQVFDLTYVMTSGGPGNATLSPVMMIYAAAFSSRKMGYASAMACVLAVLIFIVSMLLRRVFREKVGRESV